MTDVRADLNETSLLIDDEREERNSVIGTMPSSSAPFPELNADVMKLLSVKIPYVPDLYQFRLVSKQMNKLIEKTPAGKLARVASDRYPSSISMAIAKSNYANNKTAVDICTDKIIKNCDANSVIRCMGSLHCNKNHFIAIGCGVIGGVISYVFRPADYLLSISVAASTYVVSRFVTGCLIEHCFLFNKKVDVEHQMRMVNQIKNHLKKPINEDDRQEIVTSMGLHK